MSVNPKKVFSVFRKNYTLVPLEIFKSDPYKTLISTLLSARTRDETTLIASNRLFKKAPGIKTLGSLKKEEIRKLIYPVGFYKTKAGHLKKLAKMINSVFKGQIPRTRTDLVRLPGVGIKTANLVLNRAFDIPAIAVDTHVHKISNLLGWVKTKTPEQTEKALTEFLPKKYWSEVNILFVSIGRKFKTKKRVLGFLRKEDLI